MRQPLSQLAGTPFQLVWWGWAAVAERWSHRKCTLLGHLGPYPLREPGDPERGCIYRWRFVIGPLEVRRWA